MAFSNNLRLIVLVAFLVATFLVVSSEAASVAYNHDTSTASELGRKVKAERQYYYPYPPTYGSPGYGSPPGYRPPPGGGYSPYPPGKGK